MGFKEYITEAVAIPDSVKGMAKPKVKRILNKIMDKHSKGLFKDQGWNPIMAMFKDFDKIKDMTWYVDKSEYIKEKGVPTAKKWDLRFNWIGKGDRDQKMYGIVTAHGAGSVKDPLEKYDISAYVS